MTEDSNPASQNDVNSTELIKSKYLIDGEQDKFTKTTEYQTSYISFKSDLVDTYVKSLSSLGIGSAIIKFDLLYRQKGDIDALLIQMTNTYFFFDDHMSDPRILKDLEIIFLADGEPIYTGKQTSHDFGNGKYAGFDETAIVEFELPKLIQLVNAKDLEFRMSGSRGVFIEQKLDFLQFAKIKGFYNALFDSTFEVDQLLKAIKDQEKKDKQEEARRKEKEKKETQVKAKEAPSSSCFVVTATMGDINHPIVTNFRRYRDEHLLTNYWGSVFVRFYYVIGPFFAMIIRKNEMLRNALYTYFISPINKRIMK